MLLCFLANDSVPLTDVIRQMLLVMPASCIHTYTQRDSHTAEQGMHYLSFINMKHRLT
jgi:hypothetical protein